MFQFQTGSIRRNVQPSLLTPYRVFQFQTGSIRSSNNEGTSQYKL